MRAFTAAVIFCLVAGVAPSAAVPTMKSEHTTRKPAVTRATSEIHKVYGYNFLKAVVSAVLATGVTTALGIYATTPKPSNSNSTREFFERFDEQISQELAARTLKRELPTTPIDNLD